MVAFRVILIIVIIAIWKVRKFHYNELFKNNRIVTPKDLISELSEFESFCFIFLILFMTVLTIVEW